MVAAEAKNYADKQAQKDGATSINGQVGDMAGGLIFLVVAIVLVTLGAVFYLVLRKKKTAESAKENVDENIAAYSDDAEPEIV